MRYAALLLVLVAGAAGSMAFKPAHSKAKVPCSVGDFEVYPGTNWAGSYSPNQSGNSGIFFVENLTGGSITITGWTASATNGTTITGFDTSPPQPLSPTPGRVDIGVQFTTGGKGLVYVKFNAFEGSCERTDSVSFHVT